MSINEIIVGVIALGLRTDACAADRNVNGEVTIDELLRAVGYALNGIPTPLPTPTASATVPPTFTARPTDTPLAPPSATATATVSPTPSASATSPFTPSLTPTPTATPTPSITRTATGTPTATPTATMSPGTAPEITDINCNGSTGCLLALGDEFTVAFSFVDADGDAASWKMMAERDDGEIFELGGGSYAPLRAFGTTTVPFDPFECPFESCIATDWLFTVVVTDFAGNESIPASVPISVLGSDDG